MKKESLKNKLRDKGYIFISGDIHDHLNKILVRGKGRLFIYGTKQVLRVNNSDYRDVKELKAVAKYKKEKEIINQELKEGLNEYFVA